MRLEFQAGEVRLGRLCQDWRFWRTNVITGEVEAAIRVALSNDLRINNRQNSSNRHVAERSQETVSDGASSYQHRTGNIEGCRKAALGDAKLCEIHGQRKGEARQARRPDDTMQRSRRNMACSQRYEQRMSALIRMTQRNRIDDDATMSQ